MNDFINQHTDDVTGTMAIAMKNTIANQYETNYGWLAAYATPRSALIVGIPALALAAFILYELMTWLGFLINVAAVVIVAVFCVFVVRKIQKPVPPSFS